VLVCQYKSRDSASVSVQEQRQCLCVSTGAETVLVCQYRSRDSASVSVNIKQRQC
jgi:hypothetical protein